MIKTVIERTKEELARNDDINSIIYHAFNDSYGELYNLIDLVFDEKKAEYAKGLIGGMLNRTRMNCSDWVIDRLNNKTSKDRVT